MQANTYDGKVWGVPWYTDAGLLYYRQDLLEKSGFSDGPHDLGGAQGDGPQVSKTRASTTASSSRARVRGRVCNGLEYIWSHGGDVLDPEDPSKVIIDSPEAAAGSRRIAA